MYLMVQWRIQGGCFGCSSTPLNNRIHSFVSAMAQDFIYAKVAPPTTLERKRFGYKQHANRSNCRGARENAPPISAICHAFLSCSHSACSLAATAKYARPRELRDLVSRGTRLSVFRAQRGRYLVWRSHTLSHKEERVWSA